MEITEKKQRVAWIDVMKGYCMLFVMLHHFGDLPQVYYSFYAPFFLTAFFVSGGITFSIKRGWASFYISRILTLLVPLFLLGAINILSSAIISFNEQVNIGQQLLDLVVQQGTGGHRLWFIAAMFVYSCVFYPIAKLCNGKNWLVLIIICVFAIANMLVNNLVDYGALPWHIETLGIGVFWIGLGFLLKGTLNKINDVVTGNLKGWLILLVVFAVYIAFLSFDVFVLDLTYISFADFKHPVTFILTNIAGTLFIALFSMMTAKLKFLQFIGRNTLFYFAFHGKIQSLLTVFLNKLNFVALMSDIWFITVIVLVLLEAVILIIPCILFNDFLPFTVGKKYRKENFDKYTKLFKKKDANENSASQ